MQRQFAVPFLLTALGSTFIQCSLVVPLLLLRSVLVCSDCSPMHEASYQIPASVSLFLLLLLSLCSFLIWNRKRSIASGLFLSCFFGLLLLIFALEI